MPWIDRLRDMIPLISRLPSKEKREQKKAISFFTSTIWTVIKEKRQKMDRGKLKFAKERNRGKWTQVSISLRRKETTENTHLS